MTHPELKRLSPGEAEGEIACLKDTIEPELGTQVKSFSYPFAFPETNKAFGRTLLNLLEKHGYDRGVSTIISTANNCSDHFFMPRIPANSWDGGPFFRAKLEGGYDWLYVFQYASKFVR
ncbi:MAG: hypothetical protein A3G41_07150 [Elusimicrobia bacterium RIFCSPLOWO2_12_FULL_59_9]|nr:MAG: hypothetical protein A3G41_07150 [Elusimicrobia bacterium RIFCSPLOWO2_12_FULL_59_9]